LNPPQTPKQEQQQQQQAETDSATRNVRKVQCTQPQNPDFDQSKVRKGDSLENLQEREKIWLQLQEIILTIKASGQQCISLYI